MRPDIAININGNYVGDDFNNLLIVSGNSRLRQDIYLALVEMPTQQVIGQRYLGTAVVEQTIVQYLILTLGNKYSLPTSTLTATANRLADESISVIVSFPSVQNPSEEEQIQLIYKGREGYQAQINYNFEPDLSTYPITNTAITEVIIVDKEVIRIPLTYEYSGISPIRIYNRKDVAIIENTQAQFRIEENIRKYNVVDILDNANTFIDTVTIVGGLEYIDQKAPGPGGKVIPVPFEDGTPVIYTIKDAPVGALIELNITHGNAENMSETVEKYLDEIDEGVFGMKPIRYKYVALLNEPLSPGEYKAIYRANLRHPGEYNK